MGEELPIENILPLAKSSVFDLRKNDLFWPSFTALMSVYFNPKLNSDTMIQALDAIFEQSEFIQGLALVMLNRVANNFQEYPEDFKNYCIAKCVIYGPVHKKDQILLNITNEYIYSNNFAVTHIEGSDHLVDVQVRLKAVELLLQYPPKVSIFLCNHVIFNLTLVSYLFLGYQKTG